MMSFFLFYLLGEIIIVCGKSIHQLELRYTPQVSCCNEMPALLTQSAQGISVLDARTTSAITLISLPSFLSGCLRVTIARNRCRQRSIEVSYLWRGNLDVSRK